MATYKKSNKPKTSTLINLDTEEVMKMNQQELKQVVSQIANVANARIRKEKDWVVHSPAYLAAQRTGGNFGVKGMDLNQLRAEYIREVNFMKSKTSTTKGMLEYRGKLNELTSGLVSPSYKFADIETENLFWSTFAKIKEANPSLFAIKYEAEKLYARLTDTLNHNKHLSKEELQEVLIKAGDEFVRERIKEYEFDGAVDLGGN